MVKKWITILFLIGLFCCHAQSNKLPHRLALMGTLSPGIPLYIGGTNYYFHGFAEVYVEKKISIRGDLNYSLGSTTSKFPFSNHDIAGGFLYHLGNSNFDPYLGLLAGGGISKLFDYNINAMTDYNFSPVVKPLLGARYFMGSYFNVFAETSYIKKSNISSVGYTKLDELRFSCGLGFNF